MTLETDCSKCCAYPGTTEILSTRVGFACSIL